MDKQIKDVKEKVSDWLKEEKLQPEQVDSPSHYWLYRINVYGERIYVAQNTNYNDSIVVFGVWNLNQQQKESLNRLDEKTRTEFGLDVGYKLLSNNALAYYIIKDNVPKDINRVEIGGQRIFYEGLSKEKLVHSIHNVSNAGGVVGMCLSKFIGFSPPNRELKSPYS